MSDPPPVLRLLQHPQAVEVGGRWQVCYPGVDLVADGNTRDEVIAALSAEFTSRVVGDQHFRDALFVFAQRAVDDPEPGATAEYLREIVTGTGCAR